MGMAGELQLHQHPEPLAFRCGVECSGTLVVPSELYRRSSSLGFYSDAKFYSDIKSFQDPELA